MIKLCLILVVLTQSLAAFCQERTYTCSDIYQREISRKLNSRKAQGNILGPVALGGFVASIPLGITPAYLIAFGTLAVAKNVRDALGVKEERALALIKEGTRQFNSLVKKVNRKTDASKEEILAIVQEGFSNGDFCADQKLASFKVIKDYVISKVENVRTTSY
jgi:hypothetical protein